MNKNKLVYLSPKTETLVIRFGGNVMNQASPGVTVGGSKGLGYGDTMYLLDDDED